jgi:hypothetical protein
MDGLEILIVITGLINPILWIMCYRLGRLDGYDNGYEEAMLDALEVVNEVTKERRDDIE